jgi:hypothetical protein
MTQHTSRRYLKCFSEPAGIWSVIHTEAASRQEPLCGGPALYAATFRHDKG